jgi:FAD/FMN-containing dehydrogenase
LTCDNLLAVDLVTAQGELLTANAKENSDLFWALRGGGGNFGVVTGLEFQLHPVTEVLAGMVIHSLARAREALQFYREYTRSSPDDLTVDAAIVTAPDGNAVLGFIPCYCGSPVEGEKMLAPLRAYGPPVADLVRPMTVTEAHALSDPFSPAGRNYYFRAHGLPLLTDEAIDQILEYASARTSSFSVVVLRHFHGLATRIPREATAVPVRNEQYILEIIAQWTDGDVKRHVEWADSFATAIKPFSSGTMFANFLGEEGEARVRASYGTNYQRLVRVKREYDPTNFFHLNQNIKPAAC